ncbi:MAG: alkB [bacterium]|nr:MAG: alkB [bacterium]
MQLERFYLPDADILFCPGFFNQAQSNQLFEKLLNEIHWENGTVKIFGKILAEPRQTAWYGDERLVYTYSGKQQQTKAWTEALLIIKQKIETILTIQFNSVLLNLYRNGKDSVGWHSDDEKELGQNPIIASISFGASRTFRLKHRENPSLRQNIELTHGSLLIMKGTTQHFWKHQIPKTRTPVQPRVNLTFRNIKNTISAK